MSTFSGYIKEIPNISVDNFENKDLKCYFLSHCHSDHMRNLEQLSQISATLYTTQLSEKIVRQQYPSIIIQVLEYGYPTNIQFTQDDGTDVRFIVTALNGTGHCLGACMFLFQIEGLDILYTGDFRISLAHAKNIKVLNDIKNYKNLILYLDTTFLSESYKHFPSQKDSCTKVIDVIKKHLVSSSSHKICLQTSARYGYERLLIQIYKELNEQIFIHEQNVYELYSIISDLTQCITKNKHKSRIILKPSYVQMDDKLTEDRNTLIIQLSAMFWKNWKQGSSIDCKTDGKNLVRVCYATHNSLSELEDFVKFLEPKSINPTVIPDNFIEKEMLMTSVRRLVKSFNQIPEKVSEPKKKFRFKRLYDFVDFSADVNKQRVKIFKK